MLHHYPWGKGGSVTVDRPAPSPWRRSGEGMAHPEDSGGAHAGRSNEANAGKVATTVLHVGGLNWASEKAVVEGVLSRATGVRLVEANPVAQTANVTFDTVQASLAQLRSCVEECGYHSVGQSVPSYVCDPMAEPAPVDARAATPATPADG